MSGIDFVADTNALLYVFKKNPCMLPYLNCPIGVSVITEMELLSFKNISQEEEFYFRKMLTHCAITSLSENIKERSIFIRRTYGTKLPDAIIAATALELEVPLITADKGFSKITELDLCLLEPKA